MNNYKPGQPPMIPENPPVHIRRPKPLPENKASLLLSRDENQCIFDILGKGRQTLSTAVAQLLVPTPDQQRWYVKETGVLCLVRDTTKKSYFIQVFSLRSKSMVFRQEIYSQFDYLMPQSSFLTFEGDTSMVGINFADRVEAVNFKEALDNKLESKRHRKNERRSRIFDQQQVVNKPPPPQQAYPPQPSIMSNGTSVMPPTFNHVTKSRFSYKKDKKKDKGKKPLLRKEDIGTPTDFRHVQHVGWDPSRGFDLDGVDKNFQAFFEKAGISRSQLEDENTREFIYNFIEEYQAKEEAVAPTPPAHRPPPPPMATNNNFPPPVPIRHSPLLHHSGIGNKAPPPPPPSRGVPPPPSNLISSQPPPRPVPITKANLNGHQAPSSQGGPPPPPPPPMPMGAPAPPPPPPMNMGYMSDGIDSGMESGSAGSVSEQRKQIQPAEEDDRSALMKQIQGGVSLKKVDPVEAQKKAAGGGGAGLSGCLDQIKTGVDLKKTLITPKIPQTTEAMDGMAGALARALAERSRAINPESSSSGEDEEDAFDEDEWD